MSTLRCVTAAAAAGLLALALAGCGSGGAQPAVESVTMSTDELQGAEVDLVVGQVLNITTGDLAVDSYTAQVADASIAEFIPGASNGGATENPGIRALAEGETKIVLANTDGGIQDVTFTVDVD
ncbi:hypothetical protein [Microbacterium sp.]|uniref:hypothetical protein n=1 Tax=Microbacterium sp. TaxID=51671 RepID=UPI003C746616